MEIASNTIIYWNKHSNFEAITRNFILRFIWKWFCLLFIAPSRSKVRTLCHWKSHSHNNHRFINSFLIENNFPFLHEDNIYIYFLYFCIELGYWTREQRKTMRRKTNRNHLANSTNVGIIIGKHYSVLLICLSFPSSLSHFTCLTFYYQRTSGNDHDYVYVPQLFAVKPHVCLLVCARQFKHRLMVNGSFKQSVANK